MYTIVVHPQYSNKLKEPRPTLKKEIVLDEGYNQSQAELRALRWLLYCPSDIVMIVKVDTDHCKHCDLPIQEKPGWVLHRWIHSGSGFYNCAYPAMTKAEPKE